MKNEVLRQSAKNGYWRVFILWLLFQALWYAFLGVHFDLEAEKYIHEAQYILRFHQFSESRYLFYFSTIFVIAICNVFGLGLYGALFIIMAINLFSYLYFFKALCYLFKNSISAYVVIFLLLS